VVNILSLDINYNHYKLFLDNGSRGQIHEAIHKLK